MSVTATTATNTAAQPVLAPAKPAITPEALETAQIEALYDDYREDRMGRYGY